MARVRGSVRTAVCLLVVCGLFMYLVSFPYDPGGQYISGSKSEEDEQSFKFLRELLIKDSYEADTAWTDTSFEDNTVIDELPALVIPETIGHNLAKSEFPVKKNKDGVLPPRTRAPGLRSGGSQTWASSVAMLRTVFDRRSGMKIPMPCSSKIHVVILVHSLANNFHQRNLQRSAINSLQRPNASLNVKVVFVLFLPEGTTSKLTEISEEHSQHGDTLLVSLPESYGHLVFKHMAGYNWIEHNCPNVQYIIKMDDDIWVDLPEFLKVVGKNVPNSDEWMMGLLQINLPVERGLASKWFVPKSVFPEDQYPDFLSGWCYVTNIKTIVKILRFARDYFGIKSPEVLGSNSEETFATSLNEKAVKETRPNSVPEDPEGWAGLMWIDDLWITGFMADKLKIERISLNMYYTVYSEILSCCSDLEAVQQPLSLSSSSELINPPKSERKFPKGLLASRGGITSSTGQSMASKGPQMTCPFLVGPLNGNNTLFANLINNRKLSSQRKWRTQGSKTAGVGGLDHYQNLLPSGQFDRAEVVRLCHVNNPFFMTPHAQAVGSVIEI